MINNEEGVTRINNEEPIIPVQQPIQQLEVEEPNITIDDTTDQLIVDDNIEEQPIEDKQDDTISVSKRTQQKVLQELDINYSEKLDYGDTLVLPANFDRETREVLENMPNVKILDNPESRQWASDVAEGLELSTYGETYVPTLEDQDSEFIHKFEHAGSNLTAQSPKFKAAENQNLKGERAVLRFISHLGLGTLFQVPLWHSGLWVTFKPPSDSEIIELNRLIMSDKIKLGRYTYGLSFSNTSSYTTDRLVDFALAHVYDITAKSEDITINNLKSHISCQDIPSLLWGFACTMYPKGFRYRRACVNNPSKCNHVVEDTLNISKLQWTNKLALTDWQKTHMSSRQSKIKDIESIKRYKEELQKIQPKKIIINEGKRNEVSITIKTPTIDEYIDSGYRWISELVDTVDKAANLDINDNDRNAFITRHGQATAMRQYSHWIASLEYDTNIIDDRETIESNLDIISQDDEIRTNFIKAVIDYINSSTISVIGIPVYDCPNCSTTQQGSLDLPKFVNIIPLDVIQLFFALITQRITSLATR